MGRTDRRDWPGAWHHVMNQGTGKVDIFTDDVDRRYFNSLLAQLGPGFQVEVHAYAQVGNHYHLLVRSQDGRLSDAMHWLGTHYAKRFNRRQGRVGAFFRGRYTSKLVEDERYLAWLPVYIHLNPVHDGFAVRPEDWRWSSYAAIVGERQREAWLVPGVVGRGMSTDEYRRLTERHRRPVVGAGVGPLHTPKAVHEEWDRPRLERRVAEIERVVATSFGVPIDEIHNPSGRSPARTVAIALLDADPGLGRGLIAERYRFRSSQAVANAARRATDLLLTDTRAVAARAAITSL